MHRFHPQIAARVFNTPLLIDASKLDAIAGALFRQWGVEAPGLYITPQGERRDPGYRVINGIGVIDVFGVLAHRGGLSADSTYILGYQTIARMLDSVLADPEIHSIVMPMDSPGGEVAGAFELAQKIREATRIKPIYAIADSLAASACYLLGAAATSLSVSRTGHTGSIGVVWRHVDFSAALANDGISVTHVYAGAMKVAGNPFEPLQADVRAEFQAEIDKLYQMFIAAVADYRAMDAKTLINTEARVYLGQDGVDIGLADRVETADELIARISGTVATGAGSRQTAATAANRERGEITMPPEEQQQQLNGGEPNKATTEAHAKAIAAARAEGHAEGLAQGHAAERERISAILGSESAAGREKLAKHIAFDADMSAEQAEGMLAASAVEAIAGKVSSLSPLERAMAVTDQPGIGVDSADAETGDADKRTSLASEIAAGANA